MSDFITRNRPDWDELEKLIQRGRRSIRRLGPNDLNRLDVLYRRVTVHLAQVRTRTRDERLAVYLNGLAAAAHSLIYLPPRQGILGKVFDFAAYGFAECIARNWRFHVASALLLVMGAILAYYASTHDVLAAYALLPAGDIRQPGATPETLTQLMRSGRDWDQGVKGLFASFLFSHNLEISIVALGLGVLAGVPTVLLILYNGMILGAFAAVHMQAGVGKEMWAWILPHGVTEFSAIILCGGCGFMLGKAVISPGLKTRAASLVEAGSESARTVLGAAGLLAISAINESYLRQSHLSTNPRLIFAGMMAVLWILYLLNGFIRVHLLTPRSVREAAESG